MRLKQRFIYTLLWVACRFKRNKLLDGDLLGRGFGKSFILLKLAKRFNYPIFVPTFQHAQNLRQMALSYYHRSLDGINIKVMTSDNKFVLMNMDFETCLVDEGFTIAQLRVLRQNISQNHVVIGYF